MDYSCACMAWYTSIILHSHEDSDIIHYTINLEYNIIANSDFHFDTCRERKADSVAIHQIEERLLGSR